MLGVERQREDCEALAARMGWDVAEVFIDDDRSAYSGKPRPAYLEMLQALKDGRVDAVIAWHPDRLHRSPRELEDFIALIESTGAQIATVQAGELDLSTASGRMTARVVGAVARHESEQKSERIRRQRDQAAREGLPTGGRRPLGYRPGGMEIDPEEAELVREAVRRFIGGESIRSIALDWNRRGLRTTTGAAWTTNTLRTVLPSPRIAGLRVHRGVVIGDAAWPAIITRQQHDLIVAKLGNVRAPTRGRPPTSLLWGVIVCGNCGARMNHTFTKVHGARYLCPSNPGRDSCGRLAIRAEPVEEAVVEAVLRVLNQPLNLPSEAVGEDLSRIDEDEDFLAVQLANGDITQRAWSQAAAVIKRRRERALDVIHDQARRDVLSGNLAEAWPEMDTDRRRTVIGAVIDRIVVKPAERGNYRDPVQRLQIEWSV